MTYNLNRESFWCSSLALHAPHESSLSSCWRFSSLHVSSLTGGSISMGAGNDPVGSNFTRCVMSHGHVRCTRCACVTLGTTAPPKKAMPFSVYMYIYLYLDCLHGVCECHGPAKVLQLARKTASLRRHDIKARVTPKCQFSFWVGHNWVR